MAVRTAAEEGPRRSGGQAAPGGGGERRLGILLDGEVPAPVTVRGDLHGGDGTRPDRAHQGYDQRRLSDAAAVAAVETLRNAIAAGLETPCLNSPALASLANRSDFIALRQTASVAEQPVEDLAGK